MRPGGYTQEVRRPNLIDEAEPRQSSPAEARRSSYPSADDPPTGARFPGYTAEVRRSLIPEASPIARTNLGPFDSFGTSRSMGLSMPPAPSTASHQGFARPSMIAGLERGRPASFEENASLEAQVLAATSQTHANMAFERQWLEDPLYQDAMDLRAHGRKLDAMLTLEKLLEHSPDHEFGRREMFAIAMELRLEPRVRAQIDWTLLDQARTREFARLCGTYRSVRMAFPNLSFGEHALVATVHAGDQMQDGRVIVDATKLLLRDYPKSHALPHAFMASAQVQVREGRPDLAKQTLENLIARFPFDALVAHARKRLLELAG
jgi:hypothetical protein